MSAESITFWKIAVKGRDQATEQLFSFKILFLKFYQPIYYWYSHFFSKYLSSYWIFSHFFVFLTHFTSSTFSSPFQPKAVHFWTEMDCFWLKSVMVCDKATPKHQNVAHFTFVSTIGSCRSMIRSWNCSFTHNSTTVTTISIEIYWISPDFCCFLLNFYWFSKIVIDLWGTLIRAGVPSFPSPTVLIASQPSTVSHEFMHVHSIYNNFQQTFLLQKITFFEV